MENSDRIVSESSMADTMDRIVGPDNRIVGPDSGQKWAKVGF